MEALRAHLGIERWLIAGGSWGTTLALAYALRHPSRVSELVLQDVTTSRPVEAEWLYGGLSRFLPEAWERFRAHVDADHAEGVIAAYAERLQHSDVTVRTAAAREWCAWEEAALSLEPYPAAIFADMPTADAIAFARICAHYLRHGAWLEEGELIRDAGRLAGIAGVLIHGRRDLTCPIDTAYALAKRWPGAALVDLANAGHLRSDSKRTALLGALDRFARPRDQST